MTHDIARLDLGTRRRLTELEAALQAAGRRVVSLRVLDADDEGASSLQRKYAAARAAQMRLPGPGHARQQTLYHTTSCAAANSIARTGFDLAFSGKNVGAFGRGVNLGATTDQALIYAFQRRRACTLICRAAVGRAHANSSRPDPRLEPKAAASAPTVPRYVRPRAGYDSMTGAGRSIVVVPDPARVLPVTIVTHERLA